MLTKTRSFVFRLFGALILLTLLVYSLGGTLARALSGVSADISETITDLAGNPLGGLPFTNGEVYTIEKVPTPANGEGLTHRRPTFNWLDIPNASSYKIAVSTSTSFSTVLWKVNTTDSTYTPPADLPGGKVLHWRVRAMVNGAWGPWSETRSFTTPKPPSIPVLVTPVHASLTKNYTPLLDWNNSTVSSGGLAFDHYQVQVATEKTFADPVLIDDMTSMGEITASAYTPPSDLAANSKYYWRVRSFNTAGQYSSWSTVWSFRTALPPPGNLTPQGGEVVVSRKPALDWDAVDGASGYSLQLSTDSSFATLLVNTPMTTNTFTPATNLPANRMLYWRVRATGTNGPSRWSSVGSFHTP